MNCYDISRPTLAGPQRSSLALFNLILSLLFFSWLGIAQAADPEPSIEEMLRNLQGGLARGDLIDESPIGPEQKLWTSLNPNSILYGLSALAGERGDILVTKHGAYSFIEIETIKSDPLVRSWLTRRDADLGQMDAKPFLKALTKGYLSPISDGALGEVFYLNDETLSSYARSGIELGLSALKASNSSEAIERQSLFLQVSSLSTVGSFPKAAMLQAGPTLGLCTYGAGTSTPCNAKVAVVWGHDPGTSAFSPGVDGFNGFQTLLTSLGYGVTQVDLDSQGPPVVAGDESALSALADAQTIILNMHGGFGGVGVLQCYDSVVGWQDALYQGQQISGPSEACCNLLKDSAVAMGLDNASAMDCSAAHPNRRPTSDTTGSLLISDLRRVGTGCGLPGQPLCPCGSGSLPDCPCELSNPNPCQIFSTLSLFNSLGTRAAVATSQCFGGQCVNAPAKLADFITQSSFSNYPATEKCDDAQLVADLSGQSVYCKDPATSVNQEPWSGAPSPRCTGTTDILESSPPSFLRTIQGSIGTRLSWSPSQEQLTCQTTYVPTGWKQYQTAGLGGGGAAAIELYPTVLGAGQVTLFGTKWLVVNFTSKIDFASCAFDLLLVGTSPKLSTDSIVANKQCLAQIAKAIFNPTIALMGLTDWNKDPQELRDFYDRDQSDWPWYIQTKINAQAPNGIALVGNAGAPDFWLWGQKTEPNLLPPYEYTLGAFPQGGSTFEVRLPVKPANSCCMPYIEWSQDPSSGVITPIQNGCKCYANFGKSTCFFGTCVNPDGSKVGEPGLPSDQCSGTYKKFEGQWNPGYDCCVGTETSCEPYIEEVFPMPDDCSYGEEYISKRVTYQFKARPWDTSSVQSCAPIETFVTCEDKDPSL